VNDKGAYLNYVRTSSMKQITPPALTEVRNQTRARKGESDLVLNITYKCLELLLELAPNARAGHDS